jgi:steroid 5-alpha reductase family enzyme
MAEAPSTGKLYIRGTISNSVAGALLFLIGYYLDVALYVLIAVGLQAAVYLLHGLPWRSERFYDLSGSATHLAVVVASLVSVERNRTPRQIFTAVASVIWMTRLGTLLYLRISKDGKDGRFDHLKPNWLAFLGAWTIQALWVTAIQMPVVLINSEDDTKPLWFVDYICMAVWFLAFMLEVEADNQKTVFRSVLENKNKFITTGVWSYCRHPNYSGEIMMWVAQATMVSLSDGGTRVYWAWLSPAVTAILLLKVSGVPMVEAAGMQKWGSDPAYLHYIKNTSCLVPWFPAPPLCESSAPLAGN